MPEPLTAYNFADPGESSCNGFRWGVSPLEAAATLRELADRIEKGEANLQDVRVQTSASITQFASTTMTLRFQESKKA